MPGTSWPRTATWRRRTSVCDELPARDTRYDYADEVVEAVCKLWESWDADALVLDKQRGVFADPDKVHYVNYHGRWINTRGPLTVPRSPQGRPVIMQAGSSPRGRDFAARWGELVFTLQHSKSDMQAFYQDLKSRAVAQGRAPEQCLILPSIDIILGETDAIARERQEYVNDLVQTEAGMAQMSGHIGIDLSRLPPDLPLSDMDIEAGSRGSLDVILQGTQAQGLTLGEAARRFATSELCPQIVGSPATVADQLQDLFESHALRRFHPDADLDAGHVRTVRARRRAAVAGARSVPPRLRRQDTARTLAGDLMQIAVTGGLGRLGRYVVRALASHDVRVLDIGAGDECVQADLRDLAALRAALRGSEVVVHLGGIDRSVATDDAETMQVNAMGTWNLFEASLQRRRSPRRPLLQQLCARTGPEQSAYAAALSADR